MCTFKKLLFSATLLIFLLCQSVFVYADSVYENINTGYSGVIVDKWDRLSEGQEQELLDIMRRATQYANIAYVIVEEDNDDAGTEKAAAAYLHNLFGRNTNSTVFYVDLNELYIYNEGAASYIITSGKSYSITDNAFRYIQKNDYFSGGKVALDQMRRVLSGLSIPEPMKHICNALLALLLGALICFSWIMKSSRKKISEATALISGGRRLVDAGRPVILPTGKAERIREYDISDGHIHRGHHSRFGGGFSGGGGFGGGHHSGGGHHR